MRLAIIDFNGTLYDPMSGGLMIGAKELLEGLRNKGIAMVLVSRQFFGSSGDELDRLGIRDYFTDVAFVAEKNAEHFRAIMKAHGAKPEETVVIGDHPFSEIRAGNEAGAYTILLQSSEFSEQTVKEAGARAVIHNLSDALSRVH